MLDRGESGSAFLPGQKSMDRHSLTEVLTRMNAWSGSTPFPPHGGKGWGWGPLSAFAREVLTAMTLALPPIGGRGANTRGEPCWLSALARGSSRGSITLPPEWGEGPGMGAPRIVAPTAL